MLYSALFVLFPSVSADDMGLGKTLTMIALILTQKKKKKKDVKDSELEGWISKTGKHSSTLVLSVAYFTDFGCVGLSKEWYLLPFL